MIPFPFCSRSSCWPADLCFFALISLSLDVLSAPHYLFLVWFPFPAYSPPCFASFFHSSRQCSPLKCGQHCTDPMYICRLIWAWLSWVCVHEYCMTGSPALDKIRTQSFPLVNWKPLWPTAVRSRAPESSFSQATLRPLWSPLPSNPKPAFQMDTNQKALLGETEQSVGKWG